MAYEWLAYCNTKNMKERGNYGVRVARPGFDANYCSDNQLIFNSGWPILQLVKVIDFDSEYVTETRYLLPDGRWSTTLPSGYTLNATAAWSSEKYQANSVYARMGYQEKYYINSSYKVVTAFIYRRKVHNLGYTPLFLDSNKVSGKNTNKMLLFNVELETDVDYPYTEEALPLITAPNDYGMKSSSVFGDRVPGLSTGQFSKLVQAVKTEQTAKYNLVNNNGQGLIPIWSPLNSVPSTAADSSILMPYEAWGYGVQGYITYDSNYNPRYSYDEGNDGGGYYYMYSYASPVSDNYGAGYAYSLIGNALGGQAFKKATLVILRSPLVSPEYNVIQSPGYRS